MNMISVRATRCRRPPARLARVDVSRSVWRPDTAFALCLQEDPAGFVAIMEACPVYFEVNLDVSHYNFRQIRHSQSKHLRTIYERVGHTHQRMCRELGDLSADVPDPGADWSSKGLTWQAFESMRCDAYMRLRCLRTPAE